MYERLLALYQAGRLTPEQLDSAVTRGWINAEQRELILASTNSENI